MAIAIDSSIILAVGDSDKTTTSLLRKLADSGYDSFVTNSPLIESGYAHLNDGQLKKAIEKGLNDLLPVWRVRALILEGVDNGIAENVALEMLKIFPQLFLQDALTLAEASIAKDIELVITWTPRLLKIDEDKLWFFCKSRDIERIRILRPDKLLEVIDSH